MSMRVTALAVAMAVGIGAHADSLVSLPDPLYAHTTPPQPEPIAARIKSIVYPTLGLPALAPYGGEVRVVVHTPSPVIDPKQWHLEIALQPVAEAARYPLEVLTVARDPRRPLTTLRARVPVRAPRDVYELRVKGPGVRDTQPNSVRVFGRSRRAYRIAVVSDHQLWDPSWKRQPGNRNAGDYPRRGERSLNRAMTRQQLAELDFFDPEFVVHTGDLLFGLEFGKEYPEAWRLWRSSRVATFMLPGNHDAYATYGVRFQGTPARALKGLTTCPSRFTAPFDWPKAYGILECVYGDVKSHLFSDLRRDGLSHWRRTFGPPYYSWDHGGLHFVALNTYDGSPARRHSYALYVDALDIHLGAPAVDNYGGTLTQAQLRWLADDLRGAGRKGTRIVVFGHHDPRGNLREPAETRYLPNRPFPSSPLGLGPFQEWNYDSAAWSSDGSGAVERPTAHSGTRLLRLLADHAHYYVDGHAHLDGHQLYSPGEELAPGVRTRRSLDFVRVTTASSAPMGRHDYWGYRLIPVERGTLLTSPYDAGRGLLSVPAGNFWTVRKGPTRVIAYNGLPRAVRGRLRFRLPWRREGWVFRDEWGHVEVPLLDVTRDAAGKAATYYVGVEVPPPAPTQGFPVRRGWQRKRLYQAVPAAGNRLPAVTLDVRDATTDQPASAPAAAGTGRVVLHPGQATVLTTARSRDPDGDSLIASFITTPDGREHRGERVAWTFAAVGRYQVRAEVVDAHGAVARVEREVEVVEVPASRPVTAPLGSPSTQPGAVSPGPRGCGCRATAGAGPGGTLILVVLWLLSRRRL